jgi:hypothetical protein
MTLKVISHDDRGENPRKARGEVHYGFVYFNDDRRVIYTNENVGPGTGGWAPITPTHIRIAKTYLEHVGVVDSAHSK